MGDVLVVAEHRNGHFPKTTLVGINAGLEMAGNRGGNCLAVVIGDHLDELLAELAKYGPRKVIGLEDPRLATSMADAVAQAVTALAKKIGAETVIATATAMSKDVMPRIAARLDAPMASEIIAINDDGSLVRPMYAGNVLATIELDGPVRVVTVRSTAFDAAVAGQAAAEVEKMKPEFDPSSLKMEFVGFNEIKSDRPQLTEARIVVSGGRGLRSGENFKTVL
ncbi:MAG: electron transfer flavoprotein subunit alpha/FixB family protein, partial [Deltaproteobacteria bacterium]|nr:electron transfer flavoprotein subunit alpha/FixB family protein [Deltaproteobacteria bacterium]